MKRAALSRLLPACLFIAVASPAAFADDAAWYVGAGMGLNHNSSAPSCSSYINAPAPGNSCVSSVVEPTLHAVAGYRLWRTLSLEAGFSSLGRFTNNYGIRGQDPTATIVVRSTATTLSAVDTLPMSSSDWALTLRLGAFSAHTQRDVSFSQYQLYTSSVAVTSGNTSSTGPLLGLGTRYSLSPSFGLRAELMEYHGVGSKQQTGQSNIDTLDISLLYSF